MQSKFESGIDRNMDEYAKVITKDTILLKLRTAMDNTTSDMLDEIRCSVKDNIPAHARRILAQ